MAAVPITQTVAAAAVTMLSAVRRIPDLLLRLADLWLEASEVAARRAIRSTMPTPSWSPGRPGLGVGIRQHTYPALRI